MHPRGWEPPIQCLHWAWNRGLQSWNDFPRSITKTRIHVPGLPALCSVLIYKSFKGNLTLLNTWSFCQQLNCTRWGRIWAPREHSVVGVRWWEDEDQNLLEGKINIRGIKSRDSPNFTNWVELYWKTQFSLYFITFSEDNPWERIFFLKSLFIYS